MGVQNDLIYLAILLATIVFCFILKSFKCKNVAYAVLGFIFVGVVCGLQIFHSFMVVLINLFIINLFPKKIIPIASFVFCFGYLAFFRCTHLFGFESPLPYTNAVQLIITLRCVGLAFEVHDYYSITSTKLSTNVTSICHQFLYSFNLIGLFTGPYYTFRVYDDMLRLNYKAPIEQEISYRLMITPIFICGFLIVYYLFPLEDVHLDSFYVNTFWYRLVYMAPIFLQLRLRCYVAWTLSEIACIVAGLGAYPEKSQPQCGSGPTTEVVVDLETKYSFETIRNIDPIGCEFAGTFREAMRYWNRSVQYWLAVYVYKRSPRALRTTITMLVSAYWHGIYAGYFLSFLTIPICLAAEDAFFGQFPEIKYTTKPGLMEVANNYKRLIWWIFRVRVFEYLAMGFLLLSYNSTIRYWSSINYLHHFALIFIILACAIRQALVRQKLKSV